MEQQAIEGSYTIALLGGALATSELGLGPQAATDFAQGVSAWGQHARAFCLSAVVRDAPEHLLHHRYQAQLPARQLCALLDFAHDTQHRLDWLNMLRAREANAPVLRLPTATLEANTLEFAKMLSARHEVLQAYAAHFQFLAEHRLSASAFEAQVAALPVAEPDQPHFITWGIPTGEPSVLLS